jgi:hypothetical protein
MKPGNDLGRAGLRLFAAVCELVCELLLVLIIKPLRVKRRAVLLFQPLESFLSRLPAPRTGPASGGSILR